MAKRGPKPKTPKPIPKSNGRKKAPCLEDQVVFESTEMSQLVRIATDVSGGYEPSAPVKIPDREALAVQLVDIALVLRFDESRNDVTLMQTILWTIIGGFFGFLGSWVTSSKKMGKVAWIFLFFLIGGICIFIFLTYRASKRAKMHHKDIIDAAIIKKTSNDC